MDEFITLMKQIDVGNLIAMGAMLWVIYNRLDKRFEKIDERFEKMDERFNKVETDSKENYSKLEIKLDKMQETITDIDRRLCRLEGAFQSKECCLLKSDSSHKVAE